MMASSSVRTVCAVTGTRAEYGLLRGIMQTIRDYPDLALQTLVTGSHLSDEFGRTVDLIRQDGFDPDSEVDMLLASDTPVAIAKSMGLGMVGFAGAFQELKPDVVLLLGDRFEILAAAATASTMNIPIAHVHGGEISEGALDDSYRHAVTKLSHMHFVATNAFRRRLIQMGEASERIVVSGAPGLDNLNRLSLPSKPDIEQRIGIALEKPLFLITYHPATLSSEDPLTGLEELLAALDAIPDAILLFTAANADAGGRAINARLRDYVERNAKRSAFVPSLGQELYLSALKHAAVVIGNSSSGLIEAPAVGTPTVNLGIRQKGRPRSETVIDCDEERVAIGSAVRQAQNSSWLAEARLAEPAYGRPRNAALIIAERLRSVDLEGILLKPFVDIPDQSLR